MGHPHGVPVQVLHGDDAEIRDPPGPESAVYHQIALACGERIVLLMRVLRAADADYEVVGFGRAFGEDLHMAQVQGLESADDK